MVDVTHGTLQFTEAARQAIEATRASFVPMWNAIIATGGGVIFTNPTVTATADLVDVVDRRQTLVAGAATFDVAATGRVVPYVMGGGGVRINSSDAPTATLTGKYRFTINFSIPSGGAAPLDETDVARVHFGQKDKVAVGLAGGGVRVQIARRHGVRVDVRVEVSADPLDTLVDGTPARVQGTPAGSIASTTTPPIQFSNTSATRGNLSDPPIASLKTFAEWGTHVGTSLTIGYFFRF
jgi:hypothetical protein